MYSDAGFEKIKSAIKDLFKEHSKGKEKPSEIIEDITNKYNNNQYTQYFDNKGDSEDIQDSINAKRKNEGDKK